MSQLLERLEGVRKTGSDQYKAKCPAHDDSDPSLSVKILSDGRVLLHCFAGCSPLDILSAVDMTMSDLFPEKLKDFKPNWYMRNEKKKNDNARLTLAIASQMRAKGERLSMKDMALEREAFLSLRGSTNGG